jgi:hypothetical protein
MLPHFQSYFEIALWMLPSLLIKMLSLYLPVFSSCHVFWNLKIIHLETVLRNMSVICVTNVAVITESNIKTDEIKYVCSLRANSHMSRITESDIKSNYISNLSPQEWLTPSAFWITQKQIHFKKSELLSELPEHACVITARSSSTPAEDAVDPSVN